MRISNYQDDDLGQKELENSRTSSYEIDKLLDDIEAALDRVDNGRISEGEPVTGTEMVNYGGDSAIGEVPAYNFEDLMYGVDTGIEESEGTHPMINSLEE